MPEKSIAEELKEIAVWLFHQSPPIIAAGAKLSSVDQVGRLLAIAERLDAAILVPKDVVEAAAGIVAGFADNGVRKYGEDSPAMALRNLAAALGWKDARK